MGYLDKWVNRRLDVTAPKPLSDSCVRPHNLLATIAAPIGRTTVFNRPTIDKVHIKTTLINGTVVTVLMLDIASLDDHMVRFSKVRYRTAAAKGTASGFILLEHQRHYHWMPVAAVAAVTLTDVRLSGDINGKPISLSSEQPRDSFATSASVLHTPDVNASSSAVVSAAASAAAHANPVANANVTISSIEDTAEIESECKTQSSENTPSVHV